MADPKPVEPCTGAIVANSAAGAVTVTARCGHAQPSSYVLDLLEPDSDEVIWSVSDLFHGDARDSHRLPWEPADGPVRLRCVAKVVPLAGIPDIRIDLLFTQVGTDGKNVKLGTVGCDKGNKDGARVIVTTIVKLSWKP